jgi:hypothetical protein
MKELSDDLREARARLQQRIEPSVLHVREAYRDAASMLVAKQNADSDTKRSDPAQDRCPANAVCDYGRDRERHEK